MLSVLPSASDPADLPRLTGFLYGLHSVVLHAQKAAQYTKCWRYPLHVLTLYVQVVPPWAPLRREVPQEVAGICTAAYVG